ncbi:MAG: META domain-containing protein [Knoellia sp.]
MRVVGWRAWTVIGVVAALLLAGAYAVWTTRDRASENDAGWLNSLDGVQGEWVSNTGFASDGTEPWKAPVRLTVSGDQLRLNAGCNHLSAEVTIEDHRAFAIGGVVMTEIGCAPEPAARDAWLAALLDDHATVQLKGSTDGPMLAFDTDAGWIGFIR